MAPGKVLRKDEVKYSVSLIESHYRDKGYYQVKVSTAILPAPDNQVDLRFTVAEGPVFTVGAIHITGNQKIASPIILRTLGVHSGDLFSQSKIFEGNRQLYMTGYFEQIDFTYSTAAAHVVDVNIRVRERATKYVKGGVGYGSATKERVTLGYEDINFLGNARKLDLTGTYSGFLTNPSHYRTTIVQPCLDCSRIFGAPASKAAPTWRANGMIASRMIRPAPRG